MLLSRAAINEYLDRELRDYLWLKQLNKRKLYAELKHFKIQPYFKTDPWLHQLVCFYIGMCEPRFLFLLDMGLGKSKILSDLLTQALREKTARRALVSVPRVINMDSWRDDLAKHSDLEPWLCNVADIEEKWYRLAEPRGDITVIDYQGLHWAVCDLKKSKGKKKKLVADEKKIRHLQKTYDFIGIDESHYLKNHQSLWFSIFRQLTKTATHVYALTGTLFDRNPEDLWSQFFLVDRGETFGENLGLFRGSFFTAESNGFGSTFVYNKRTSSDLHRMLQNKSIRYDKEEISEIDLPMRAPPIVQQLEFGTEQREHYMRALEGLINAQLGEPSKLEAPWIRMRQILSGFLQWTDEHGQHTVRFKENPKLAALEALLADMGNSKMVVCHHYTETGRIISEHLTKLKIKHEWLYGGTKDKAATRTNFMHDPDTRVLLMNSVAGGTGNDGLQTVAQYMVFFETPTDPTTRKQVEARIHRPGQRHRTFFYDLTIKRSIDKGILESIAEGHDLYEAVVNGKRLLRDILRG